MKQKLSFALVACVALGWTACSDENLKGDSPIPGELPQLGDGYIGFRFSEPEMKSRDTHKEYDDDYEKFEWFNKGTAKERAIIDNSESNRVLFFNADYSYYGTGKLQQPDIAGVASNIYVAQKPVEGDTSPSFAVVVMNGDPERLDSLDQALVQAGTDAVKTALYYLNEVDTDNPESMAMYDGYFTMSSTVYREEESDNIAVLTYLNPDNTVFFETVEEAILPQNLKTFYVERVLAKYTLLYDRGEKDFDTNQPIIMEGANMLKVRQEYAPTDNQAKDVMTKWRVNFVNWGVNGLEKNTYLFKTLIENPDSYPFSLEGNFYTGWNSPTLFRSYWGLDENYSDGVYPYQYRQALNEEGVKSATTNNIYSEDYAEELKKGDYTLIYKPYSAFTERSAHKYSVENTFDPSVMSEEDIATSPWLRCGTHILLTAQFIMDEIDTEIDLTKVDSKGFIQGVKDKYFSNGLYWSEKALREQAVATLMTNIYYNKKGDAIPNVLNGGNVPYINVAETPLDDDAPVAIEDETGEIIVLKHEDLAVNAEKYFEFAPAFIKGGDGWVSLKLKDGNKLKARCVVNKATNEIKLVDITEEQLVSYIYRFTNLAKHYKEGRMYYAIALRHNLDSRNFETDPVLKVSTGDYGVVRNTWYRMTLKSLLHPGTPVDDPDQPIIPNPEPDEKSLGVEVEIIPWRMIDITVDQLH